MNALPSHIKRFIAQRCACFDTPTEVAIAVEAEFSLKVTRNQVQCYDPTTHAGRSLSAPLRRIFFDTRERFVEELEQLPLAHRATRLRRLEQIYRDAESSGNLKSRIAAIVAAQKEMQPLEYDDEEGDGA